MPEPNAIVACANAVHRLARVANANSATRPATALTMTLPAPSWSTLALTTASNIIEV
jgi:hypothetical protein